MDAFHKQLLIFVFPVIVSLILVFSGATEFLHGLSKDLPIVGKNANEKDYSDAVGYGFEVFCIGVIIITPFCGAVSFWLLKIAYDLSFGGFAQRNVFVVSQSLNLFMSILCIVLFFFSIYSQYKWAIRFTHPGQDKSKDKDLTRFI